MPSNDKNAAPPLPEPLRVPVADAHTHLDMQSGTVEEGLAKAASAGVTTVVQVGCDIKGSRWAAETAERYAAVHATVALHPNEAPRIDDGAHNTGFCAASSSVVQTVRASPSTQRHAHVPKAFGATMSALTHSSQATAGMSESSIAWRRHRSPCNGVQTWDGQLNPPRD